MGYAKKNGTLYHDDAVFFLWRGEGFVEKQGVFFREVEALADYKLAVEMGTRSQIVFDFQTRLATAKFGVLNEEDVFRSVYTDGSYLIFKKNEQVVVKITAKEFMDLVLIDRTSDF